jgi:Domain of unknown function (DUF1843)
MSEGNNAFIPLYASPIHEAARSGDVSRMKEMEQRATQYIGDITQALETLRGEIKSGGNS